MENKAGTDLFKGPMVRDEHMAKSRMLNFYVRGQRAKRACLRRKMDFLFCGLGDIKEKNRERLKEYFQDSKEVNAMTEVFLKVRENERWLRARCEDCADILFRPMSLGKSEISCLAVYLETTVSNLMLEESMLGHLLNQFWEMPQKDMIRCVQENGMGISDVGELTTLEDGLRALLAGNLILLIDGYNRVLKIGSKGYPGKTLGLAQSEKVLRGSNEGFSEPVKVNTALVRKRIRSTDLKVKEMFLGKRSDTLINILYMEGLAYPGLVELACQRIRQYEVDGILDSGILEQLAEENWISPFPQFQTTERPDRAAMELLNGRVVILCDNSPVALLLPTTLNSFLSVSEDRYNRFEIASFQRILRYLAMCVALMFSGIYLAVIGFHTQILPTNLLLSFAEARRGVPFPSLIEVIFMELAFELIREASVRMPGPLSGTIGIVGGLIIGDAAVGANLVSPMAVVVVALSALSSFAIPNEEFSAAFRLIKYGFILLGGILGMFGIVMGMYLFLGHLAGLVSFRIPYLMPFVGKGVKDYQTEGDSLWRAPLKDMRLRPIFARRGHRVRMRRRDSDVFGQ